MGAFLYVSLSFLVGVLVGYIVVPVLDHYFFQDKDGGTLK